MVQDPGLIRSSNSSQSKVEMWHCNVVAVWVCSIVINRTAYVSKPCSELHEPIFSLSPLDITIDCEEVYKQNSYFCFKRLRTWSSMWQKLACILFFWATNEMCHHSICCCFISGIKCATHALPQWLCGLASHCLVLCTKSKILTFNPSIHFILWFSINFLGTQYVDNFWHSSVLKWTWDFWKMHSIKCDLNWKKHVCIY